MNAGLLLRAALAPLGATVLTHLALAGWPRPAVPRLLAIGPIDHVGPLEFAGQEGLLAFALMLAAFALVYRLVPVAVGGRERLGRRQAVAFGLLLGGAAANSIEVLLRGAAMDWLWLRTDEWRFLVINWADLAIGSGALGLLLGVLGTFRPLDPRGVQR